MNNIQFRKGNVVEAAEVSRDIREYDKKRSEKETWSRQLNCVKIPQGEANKSANRWGSFGAIGGVVPPSVVNQLLKCADQI
jgi:hypothetical protein